MNGRLALTLAVALLGLVIVVLRFSAPLAGANHKCGHKTAAPCATATPTATATATPTATATATPTATATATPGGGWTGSCAAGYVALTFDDGPTPMTRQYVDALSVKGARATFFNVGQNIAARPSDTAYEYSKGHRLENHTYTHPDLLWLADADVTAEIAQAAQAQIASAPNSTQELLRPPYGNYDARISYLAGLRGLTTVTWTINPQDYWFTDAASMTDYVLSRVHDKSIVLLHDGYANTLKAIGPILDGLKARDLCPGRITHSVFSSANEFGVQEFASVVGF